MDIARSSAGALLREARTKSRLSQTELARRADVAQSVISAYEAGRREPAMKTLLRLIDATDFRAVVTLEPKVNSRPGLPETPAGRRLRQRRAAILDVARRHGASNVKVFGSVARGDDRPDSDLDVVVDLPSAMGLFALGSMERALAQVTGMKVDLVPAEGLRPEVRAAIDREAIEL